MKRAAGPEHSAMVDRCKREMGSYGYFVAKDDKEPDCA